MDVNMRRRDREITDPEEFRQVLEKCEIVHIGMHDGEHIYVLPMNFGYEFENDKLVLYVHGSLEGKKWDLVRKNPDVSIEMDCDHYMIEAEKACQYGYAYASIMGVGKAEVLDDPAEKVKGLEVLMSGMTGKKFEFNERLASIVAVMKITLDSYTGKRRPIKRES